jgi:hypothetical protein
MEAAMQTNRFGKKIKLPATIAIKHDLMKLMFEESLKDATEAEAAARIEETRRSSETAS